MDTHAKKGKFFFCPGDHKQFPSGQRMKTNRHFGRACVTLLLVVCLLIQQGPLVGVYAPPRSITAAASPLLLLLPGWSRSRRKSVALFLEQHAIITSHIFLRSSSSIPPADRYIIYPSYLYNIVVTIFDKARTSSWLDGLQQQEEWWWWPPHLAY